MILRLSGRGTNLQVSIPRREANSSSAAFSQRDFLGERSSYFHVLGVSIASSLVGFTELTKFPSRFGGARFLAERRGVGGSTGLGSRVGETGGKAGTGRGAEGEEGEGQTGDSNDGGEDGILRNEEGERARLAGL